MAVYLKKFENHTQYENYINGSGAILPNVSICTTEGDVHYNPYVEPIETRLVAKYNVTDTSSSTKIANKTSGFSVMEIDGVEQPSVVSAYTFDTIGEHIVKYTLTDPTSIGGSFYNCTSLTSIYIPNSVTSIGNGAFSGCSGLTSVNIPSGVTSIGTYAFDGCRSLTGSIVIPSGVTSIGDSAFDGCRSLTGSIVIPSGVTSIGSATFRYCSGLTSIDIPNSVTSIGFEAFNYCRSLTRLNSNVDGVFNIPSGVTSIGTYTFYYCTSLTSIDIPSGVTSINKAVFMGCSGLTSIVIPSGVTSIDTQAFQSCSSLTSIVCNATTAPRIKWETFLDVKTGGTLTVPSGSSGYDVWMGTDDYYLGKYNWTKVEQ